MKMFTRIFWVLVVICLAPALILAVLLTLTSMIYEKRKFGVSFKDQWNDNQVPRELIIDLYHMLWWTIKDGEVYIPVKLLRYNEV